MWDCFDVFDMGLLRTAAYVLLISILYQQSVKFFSKKLTKSGSGHSAPGWRKVADKFRKFIDDGREKGGIVTVYYKGDPVVEFWGGYANEHAHIKWTRDTLGLYCSVAKLAHIITVGKLVDRGLLDYNSPVVQYWPEFGQKGKEKITLKQLLSHQGGVAIIDEAFSMFDAKTDPEKIGRILASQKPNWAPGSKHGYHGVTVGLYVDQIVRRVDPQHRSLSQFFHEEIAEPFDIDFFVGLPKAENYRTAFVHPLELLSLETLTAKQYWSVLYSYAALPNSYFTRSLKNPAELEREDLDNQPDFREIPLSSTHGYGTGESMAKLLGILANGGEHQGLQMLSPSTIKRLAQEEVTGFDVIAQRNISYGPGSVIRDSPHGTKVFGHFGGGGQVGFADIDNQLAWSYVTTYHSVYAFGDSPKTSEIEAAIYECLSDLNKEPVI